MRLKGKRLDGVFFFISHGGQDVRCKKVSSEQLAMSSAGVALCNDIKCGRRPLQVRFLPEEGAPKGRMMGRECENIAKRLR